MSVDDRIGGGRGLPREPDKGQSKVQEKTGSLPGRAVVKIIALPLYLASQTPRAISLTTKVGAPVIQLAAGLVAGVSKAGALGSRALKWSMLQAHKRGVLEKSSAVFKNMMETTTARADDVDAAKRQIQSTTTRGVAYVGKKVIGLIPIAGDLTEMAIDGAMEAERIINETDRYISSKAVGGAKWYLRGAADTIRVAGPLLLQGGAKTFELTERGFDWLHEKSWTIMEGKGYGLGAAATDLADALQGWTADLAHYYDAECRYDTDIEKTSSITPKMGFAHATENESCMGKFFALGREGQKDLFFLVSTSCICDLDDAQKRAYATAVSELIIKGKPDSSTETYKLLQELAGMYYHDLMKDEVVSRLTPGAFRAQDSLKQLQLYQIVRENARNLSVDEGAYLNSKMFRKMRSSADWQKLPPLEKNILEQLVVRLFNDLPKAVKEKRYNITSQMYQRLEPEKQNLLCGRLGEIVEQKGSRKDKQQWAKIESPPNSHDDIQIVINMFQKHLSKEEKFVLWNQLEGGAAIFATTLPELEKLILEKQKELDGLRGLKRNASGVEIKRLEGLIAALKNEKSLLEKDVATAEKETTSPVRAAAVQPPLTYENLQINVQSPVDIAAVMQKVGPHIISDKNFGKRVGHGVGYVPRGVSLLAGAPGWVVGRLLGSICAAEIKGYGIGEGFQLTARGLEVLLSTQAGAAIFMDGLVKLGIPIPEIEEFLALGPALAGQGLLKIQGLILQTAQASLQKSDSYLSTILDLHEKLLLERNFETNEQLIEAMKVPLQAAKESHALNVIEFCRDSINQSRPICSPEVYAQVTDSLRLLPPGVTSPEAYKLMAQASGAKFGSPEYWNAYKLMVEEGRMPGVQTTQDAVLDIAAKGAGALGKVVTAPVSFVAGAPGVVARGVYTPVRWMASWLLDPVKYESSLGHYYNAVTRNEVANTIRRGAAKVGSGISAVAGGTKEMGKRALRAAKVATGVSKPLQGDVQESFVHMAALGAEMHQLLRTKEAAQSAMRGLDALREVFLGKLALEVASSDTFATAVGFFKNTINPTLQKVAENLQAVHNVALGNQEFLKSHLDQLVKADSPVTGLLAGAMKQLETGASDQLAKDSSFSSTFTAGASYIGPIGTNVLKVAGYYYSGGWSNYYLTAMALGTVLPSVLRTLAPIVKEKGSQFWYSIAAATLDKADSTGKSLQSSCATLGGHFQRVYNMSRAGRFGIVDTQRATNFAELEPLEQEHLCELALASEQCTSQEKKEINKKIESSKALVGATLHTNLEELGKLVLSIVDRMSKQELMWLSPSFYNAMDERVRIRISDIVEKYSGLTESERDDIDAVIKKFNSLTAEQKEEVDHLSVAEYRQLSPEDQKDVCFRLAVLATDKTYFEPSLEGFAPGILYNASAYAIEHLRQFKKIQNLNNQQLAKLLPQLSNPELQPESGNRTHHRLSQLLKMSDAKLQHCFELVRRFNTPGIYALKDEKLGNLFLFENGDVSAATRKKLCPQLAILFNQLEPHQKDELLSMTAKEAQAFSAEDVKRVVTYLLARPELAHARDALQKVLVKVERILAGEKGVALTNELVFVAKTFNSMEVMTKAEFRKTDELGLETEKALYENINGQITKVQKELELLQARSSQLQTKEYMAYHHQETLLTDQLDSLAKKQELIGKQLSEVESRVPNATNKKEIESKKQELEANSRDQKQLEQQLLEAKPQLEVIVRGITRLEARAASCKAELQALAKLLEDGMSRKLGLAEQVGLLESEHKIDFDVGVEATIKMYNGIFKEMYTDKLTDLTYPYEIDTQITSTTNDIEKTLKIIKQRGEETQALIVDYEKKIMGIEKQIMKFEVNKEGAKIFQSDEVAEGFVEKLIKARLDLLTLTVFYKPLYTLLEKSSTELLDGYIVEAKLIRLSIEEKKGDN